MTLALRLRRTYPDDADERNRGRFWTVSSEGVYIGSIVLQATLAKPMWRWSITVQYASPGISKGGDGATRENAMAGFRKARDAYRASLGDDRWLQWIKHVERVDARTRIVRR